MFPTPIEKSSRAAQISYQALLPIALILWLLPLIAVVMFSIKPDADFTQGNYWGMPVGLRGLRQLRAGVLRLATCRATC